MLSGLGMQAIDLQRILDGEKAQRGDATRRMAELARQAGRLRRAGVQDEPALAELEQERRDIEVKTQQHTAQVRSRTESAEHEMLQWQRCSRGIGVKTQQHTAQVLF